MTLNLEEIERVAHVHARLTLALTARIRDLETAAGKLLAVGTCDKNCVEGCPAGDAWNDLAAVLAKGVTL